MKDSKNQQIIDSYDYLANAASANDCTGLIPAGESTESQLADYQEIYKFGAAKMQRYFDQNEEEPVK
ncbi:MAG: hypothetical protein PHC41_03270 [Lachnospiraceae bacterium]|jgi:hypothetical protein|nr:hypothetical protein [Lachnospiraceae bacterium]MDD3615227.1 hypothetical protein [Lachnospiraceae bacterium]